MRFPLHLAISLTLAVGISRSFHAQTPAPVSAPRCQVSWESDTRALNLENAADRVHVREDLARVSLTALRWANRQVSATQNSERHRALVAQCTADLIEAIAKRHQLVVSEVKALREDMPR
jgi:hypothetical protein